MSELREFTAEEMKGVPSFYSEPLCNGYSAKFLFSDGKSISVLEEEYKNLINYKWPKISCNPIDRMNAICKHLFELMPNKEAIWLHETRGAFIGLIDELSINPFLHTDRTSITREELGL